MKKVWALMILGVLSASLMGCGDACKESIFTGIGDSIATLGKSGLEKDRILAERSANRAAACVEQTGNKVAKDLGF